MRPALFLALAFAATGVSAQQNDGTSVGIQSHIVKPALTEATPERVSSLKLPAGFSIQPFATGLQNVRVIAVADNGFVYATRRDQGDVVLLKDADDDGKADGPAQQVLHRPGAHGLAVRDGRLYLATVKEIFVASIQADGSLGPATLLVGDLPDGGQHPNRTLAFGPDGMLYVSIGSTCNACNETHPEAATMLRMTPDGKSRVIMASGLRNTIGFDWHPLTGQLWGMDHGIDFLGDDEQAEELNLLVQGRQYGWPHVYGAGTIYPQSTPNGGLTKAQWREMSEPMALGHTAHAAPMQMLFYRGGQFPREYQGDALVTMRGSWNRKPPSGYEVVRIRFRGGKPTDIQPFLSGFLVDGGKRHFARPMGLAVAKDGALLVGDDANGVIYRVSHAGGGATPLTPAPAGEMEKQAKEGVGVPLADMRPETRARGTLSVQSSGFAADGPIPPKFSEYADGVSPALEWTSVPGAKSYVLIMEDPDAKPITPFVHWVAWNIPANRLPEGLAEQHRLTEPMGLLQGRNSRGSIGYFGPRPPVGDPPHRYRFQVLALDRVLDLPPGSPRDAVLAAAAGHVLAKGALQGTYQQLQKPQK